MIEVRRGEIAAVDVLHGDVRPSARLAELEDRNDRGIPQPCRETRLATEPLDVGRPGVAEELQRHRAIERPVASEVHDAAAPATEAPDQLVARRGDRLRLTRRRATPGFRPAVVAQRAGRLHRRARTLEVG
jgi:hypothetical protein